MKKKVVSRALQSPCIHSLYMSLDSIYYLRYITLPRHDKMMYVYFFKRCCSLRLVVFLQTRMGYLMATLK